MSFTKETLISFIGKASALMEENKQYLIDLDSALGDGDLGLTMTAGFAEAYAFAQASAETDLGKLTAQSGMAMSRKVPSTMGTLVASGFMGAGKAVKGKTELSDADVAVFIQGFVDGVMNRGKAQPGDRTIVDALDPGAKAFRKAIDDGSSLKAAAETAQKAAEDGVEATKNMQAKFGRAVYYADKVLGVVDQGAVVGGLIFKALNQTL